MFSVRGFSILTVFLPTFKDNIALTLLFYDIEGIKGETSWKFLLGLIIVFMIFGLLTKYRMFKP